LNLFLALLTFPVEFLALFKLVAPELLEGLNLDLALLTVHHPSLSTILPPLALTQVRSSALQCNPGRGPPLTVSAQLRPLDPELREVVEPWGT